MQQAHLDDLTLSDLRLLQILLRTESLTRASLTLGWSIPKASHRLSRIREALADELFVRSGNSIVPTARMKKLGPRVEHALKAMEALEVEEHYRPEEIERAFVFEMVDNAAVMLLGPVFERIREKAPKFRLSIRPSVGRTLEHLWEGSADLAFGFDIDRELPGDICSQSLFRSRHVFVMRRGHPLLATLADRAGPGGRLEASREDLAPWPFISIALPRWRSLSSNIDLAWRTDIPSPVCMETPFFLSVPAFLVASDAYAVLPAELAEDLSKKMALDYVEARPGDIRLWNPQIIWHARSGADFALQWLRAEIVRHWKDHAPVPEARAR